jgi:TRAP-type transport system small permease protein
MITKTAASPRGVMKALRIWQTILESAAIVMLCGSVLCIFLQIILRNLANFGSADLEELARMQFIWMAYFTIPVLYCENAHLQIDMFVKPFKGWAGFAVQLFSALACLFFATAFLWSESAFMQKGWDIVTPALGFPNLLFFAGPIIGMASLFVFTLEKLVILLRNGKGAN